MAIDPRELRDAFGRFATGVTVITVNREGRLSGLTANSFSSVSLDPPLVLWSLARDADCFDEFQGAAYFAINVLARHQETISTRFATKDVDKWAGTPHELGVTGAPLISGALATFECHVHARHEGGDHVIYVGEVQQVQVSATAAPLSFYRGRYCELVEETP